MNLLSSKRFWFNVAIVVNYAALQYFGVSAFPTPAPITIATVNAVLTILRLRFGV